MRDRSRFVSTVVLGRSFCTLPTEFKDCKGALPVKSAKCRLPALTASWWQGRSIEKETHQTHIASVCNNPFQV